MTIELEAGQVWEYTGTNGWSFLLLRSDPETDKWLTLTLWDDMEPAGDVHWHAGSWILGYHKRVA